MILCAGTDLYSRLRHPLDRFHIPRHLPYAWFPFLTGRVGLYADIFFDIALLLFVGSLIRETRSRAETGMYIGLLGIFSITPLRYFLIRVAAPLWWLRLVCVALLMLSSLALFAELGPRGRSQSELER